MIRGSDFHDRYEVDTNGGCWLWLGALHDGYGVHRTIRAHRASYEMHVGPIPRGMMVCHRCDVRCCVNPAHLFLGTNKDNMQDMARKGRACTWEGERLGSDNPRAKLTERDARYIRRSGESLHALARRFQMGRTSIRMAREGVTWRHLA